MNIVIKTKKFISKQTIDIKTYGIRELFRKLCLLIKVVINIPIKSDAKIKIFSH